jgi:hypothetical protein
MVARLFAHIEKLFGLNIPLMTLFQRPIERSRISSKTGRDAGWAPWWRFVGRIKPSAFGPARAECPLARNWPNIWNRTGQSADQSKAGGKAIFTHLEEMAAHYVNEIESIQPAGPYLLGGYCLGGTIAFEMAQQLRAKGEEVALVAMFETYNENTVSPLSRRLFWPCHLFQNIYFHWLNILSLGSNPGRQFLKKKWQTSYNRLLIRAPGIFRYSRFRRAAQEIRTYPHLRIKRINDEAQRKYIPKAYSGRVALFNPKKYFAGINDPRFGWEA